MDTRQKFETVQLYKSCIKPVWKYGIKLWGTVCPSYVNKIQRTQNYILKEISDAPWLIKNIEVYKYLNMPRLKEEIIAYARQYKVRLVNHLNQFAQRLTLPDCITE